MLDSFMTIINISLQNGHFSFKNSIALLQTPGQLIMMHNSVQYTQKLHNTMHHGWYNV